METKLSIIKKLKWNYLNVLQKLTKVSLLFFLMQLFLLVEDARAQSEFISGEAEQIANPIQERNANENSIIQNRLQIGNSASAWLSDQISGYNNGFYTNDAALFVPVSKGSDSDLRLYIMDDPSDAFSIWGNSCGGGDCGNLNKASQVARFSGDGNVIFNGKLGVGINPNQKFEVNGSGILQNRLQIGNGAIAWVSDEITGYDNGLMASDAALFVPVSKGSNSDLRLYITDDPTDAFSIWGNSCGGGDCGNLNMASQVVRFGGNGDVMFNGTVGIGLDGQADYKLAVSGGIFATDFTYFGSGTPTEDIKRKYLLAVDGAIRTRKVTVTPHGWADFVFEDSYKPKELSEVKEFIKKHKHLPNVPSQKEVEENGVDVGEMQVILLQKIEELTLYVIELEEKLEKLQGNKK